MDLGQRVLIRSDDICDLGISPRNLRIPEEDDRQAVAGNLDGAPGNAFGDDVGPLHVLDFRPFQAVAHPVRLGCHLVFRGEEGFDPLRA